MQTDSRWWLIRKIGYYLGERVSVDIKKDFDSEPVYYKKFSKPK